MEVELYSTEADHVAQPIPANQLLYLLVLFACILPMLLETFPTMSLCNTSILNIIILPTSIATSVTYLHHFLCETLPLRALKSLSSHFKTLPFTSGHLYLGKPIWNLPLNQILLPNP